MKKYAAELIATFILVFAGAGAVVADGYLSGVRITSSFGVLGIALAHGLALALAIAAVGHISGGHVNPAITIAFWITRRIKIADAAGYIVAQLAGGAAAAGALKFLLPDDALSFSGIGVPALAEGIGFREGLFIEIILTLFLAFVIWGVAIDKRGPSSIAPLAIGLVLTFDILVGGPFTGAAMNPARWFGPALAAGDWSNLLVWILGPILGALLGSLLYETLFLGEQYLAGEEEELPEEEEAPVGVSARAEAGEVTQERKPWAPSEIPPRETSPPPSSTVLPPRETPPTQPERPSWERPNEEKRDD